MTTAFISHEPSQEKRFGATNEIRPILGSHPKQQVGFTDEVEKGKAQKSRIREMLSWEFFVNELEFE